MELSKCKEIEQMIIDSSVDLFLSRNQFVDVSMLRERFKTWLKSFNGRLTFKSMLNQISKNNKNRYDVRSLVNNILFLMSLIYED